VTDRRSSIRFEIMGRLRGSLATAQPVRLQDISPGGALVELWQPLPVDSQHTVQLGAHGHVSVLDVRVRHVRPAIEFGRYLIGLEFLAPAHVVDEALGSSTERDRAEPRG
jgi:hypothetical protein